MENQCDGRGCDHHHGDGHSKKKQAEKTNEHCRDQG